MRFPKSAVQVRECGIAFRYILLGHLGGANLGTGFREGGRPCHSFYVYAKSQRECRCGLAVQAGDFQPRRPISNKGLQMQTAFGGGRRHLSQKWEYGPRPHLCPSSATRASLSVTETMTSPS